MKDKKGKIDHELYIPGLSKTEDDSSNNDFKKEHQPKVKILVDVKKNEKEGFTFTRDGEKIICKKQFRQYDTRAPRSKTQECDCIFFHQSDFEAHKEWHRNKERSQVE